MRGNRKYYWDSCAFIAWLRGESLNPGELEGFEEIVKQVENGSATLFTSALTRSEVLEGKMLPSQKKTFAELFQRKNVLSVDISDRVLNLCREIREWNSKISTPDAIHLATAILYEADEFHTTDGGGKRKRAGDLLPLSGNVAGRDLKICTPQSNQLKLALKQADLIAEAKSEKTKAATTPAIEDSSPIRPSDSTTTDSQAGAKENAKTDSKEKGTE